MPFLLVQTNQKLDRAQKIELEQEILKLVNIVPRKNPPKTLISIADDVFLSKDGNYDIPLVFLQSNAMNQHARKSAELFIDTITGIFERILGVPRENIIIQFSTIPSMSWEGEFLEIKL